MPRGRPPNHARRRRVAELRGRGLTLREIAGELGVTHQAVSELLTKARLPAPRGVPCSLCDKLIPTPAAMAADRPGALCLDCLRRTPDASEGQRLLAYRLASGLTRDEVAHLAGLSGAPVWHAERGFTPAGVRARIARVLEVPGAPSLCVVQMPPAVARSLGVLLDLVNCGPRGRTAAQLARHVAGSPYLTFAPLRRSGLVKCGKGPGHGYQLARPAAEISLWDVAEAVGWPFQLELPRVAVKGGNELHRRMQAACDEAAQALRAALRAVSLADLLDGE